MGITIYPQAWHCRKVVRVDDFSGNDCKSCEVWFRGNCVTHSVVDVTWLGSRRNCLWCSDFFPGAEENLFQAPKLKLFYSSFNEKILIRAQTSNF